MKRRQFLYASAATSLTAGVSSSVLAALDTLSQVNGDIQAVTGQGADISLLASEVQELKAGLRGRLLMPGNDGYDRLAAC